MLRREAMIASAEVLGSESCMRAPEVGLPLLCGPRRPQRKPRAHTVSRVRDEVMRALRCARRALRSHRVPRCYGTARWWRGIVALTHLAREGRMTVTIERRELLAALGGAAAWPLAARMQKPPMPVVGYPVCRFASGNEVIEFPSG